MCEVNLNVEYALSQTALMGHIDPTVKSKWEKLVEPEEGRMVSEKEEEKIIHEMQGKS